jgi:hypothetical protein
MRLISHVQNRSVGMRWISVLAAVATVALPSVGTGQSAATTADYLSASAASLQALKEWMEQRVPIRMNSPVSVFLRELPESAKDSLSSLTAGLFGEGSASWSARGMSSERCPPPPSTAPGCDRGPNRSTVIILSGLDKKNSAILVRASIEWLAEESAGEWTTRRVLLRLIRSATGGWELDPRGVAVGIH